MTRIFEIIKSILSGLKSEKTEDKVTCAGCKYLWFNCCGQAECLQNYEHACLKSGFAFREEG